MASDPPGKDDDLESRKTRFVPRPDVVERDAAGGTNRLATPGGQSPAAEEAPSGGTPGGTIIGRTRLVGDHGGGGQTALAAGGPMAPPPAASTEAMKVGDSAVTGKTQYIRGTGDMQADPVAGWVVVVKGPGRGSFRPLFVGMNSVGRDASQRVCLDFGDDSISREQHAYITYDDEQRRFYLQHGGKSNLVRLGEQPVLMPTELQPNDTIRIGKTVLRFFPCCGPEFSWSDEVADA